MHTSTLGVIASDGRSRAMRLLLVSIGAVCVAVAMPPHDRFWLAMVGWWPVAIALKETRGASRVLLGWLFGTLVNAASCLWWPTVIERFTGAGTVVSLLCALAICAYHGLVFGLGSGLSALLERARVPMWISLPLAVATIEWGFPYLFPGYLGIVAWGHPLLLQVAELGGPPLVTALVMLLGFASLEIARGALLRLHMRSDRGRHMWSDRRRHMRSDRRRHMRSDRRRASLGRLAPVLVAAGLLAASSVRLWTLAPARGSTRVAIVQPNFGTTSREVRVQAGEHLLAKLRDATDRAYERGAELVVWPESAFPYVIDRGQRAEFPVGHPWSLRTRRSGSLLAGSLTMDGDEIFNSAVLVTPAGHLSYYDKHELVPIGEYIPFAHWSPAWEAWARAHTPQALRLTPSRSGTYALAAGEKRIVPLICYEDLFFDHVALAARDRIDMLVTLANHAWFDGTAAQAQARALASLRAIETRRPLVRVANTGASSVTLPNGDTIAVLAQTQPTRFDEVPAELRVIDVPASATASIGPWTITWFVPAFALSIWLVALLRRRGVNSRGEAP